MEKNYGFRNRECGDGGGIAVDSFCAVGDRNRSSQQTKHYLRRRRRFRSNVKHGNFALLGKRDGLMNISGRRCPAICVLQVVGYFPIWFKRALL